MPEIQKYSTRERLLESDAELQGDPSLLGITMLTYVNYINSMRSTMFGNHAKQAINLLYPDTPEVFTNNENLVGKYSDGYLKAGHKMSVFRKVEKYKDILDHPRIYYLFVFDEEDKKFDVIERKVCENLTENFGFDYNNDYIDSLKEGDVINEGDVIYKSYSYDADMNYGYGKNVTTIYTLDPYTSEDAAVISESLNKQLVSVEVDEVSINLNNNDFLVNYYGDKNHYKPLPDIGETVSDILAISRRQFNNQLLFDFKDSSLQKRLEGDQTYYVGKDEEILDITIFDNNPEPITNPFYEQINKYIKEQNKFFQEVIDTIEEIKETGYEYTKNVDYLFKRASEMVDRKKRWKEKEKMFSNMEIKVLVHRKSKMTTASKFTGRYGNKSVVAKILPDDEMPYTKDGRRVDLMINLLAIINRTTSFVLYEMLINGSSYQVRQHLKTLNTLEEKEEELFRYINVFNEKQAKIMHKNYKKLKKKEKEQYIEDAINDGIYIHQLPMWETTPIFYRCQNLFKEFPYIMKNDLYVRKWGREYKVLTKYFVGDMYVIKLKQSDRRGFSARSTGALDSTSLPTKSTKSKNHLDRISTSCIRFGEFESFNFSIGIYPEDIALFHALYRTSIKGRKDLVSMMFADDDEKPKLISSTYTSRIAEIFQVILKSMGIELEFYDESDEVVSYNTTELKDHHIENKVYICTDYQFYLIKKIEKIKKEILQVFPVITRSNLIELIESELTRRHIIDTCMEDELGPDLTKRIEEEMDAYCAKVKEEEEAEKKREEEKESAASVEIDPLTGAATDDIKV